MASSKEKQPFTPSARASKPLSSNLMTMKFMQRAAASQSQKPSPAPTKPELSEPPSKRRRTDTRTPDYGRAEALAGSPATPMTDLQRIQAATAEEEAKRERAIERLGAEVGETKWVLSTTGGEETGQECREGMRVARAGYGDIDEGESGLALYAGGRRSFGRFNKEIEKGENGTAGHSSQTGPSSESSSGEVEEEEEEEEKEEEEAEVGDDDDDLAGTQDLIQVAKAEATQRVKAERKAKRKAEKQELARLAEKRKSKEVKLNRLSSISGGGGVSGGGGGRDMSRIECYECGEKGHERRDCPQKAGKRDREGDSRRRKKSGDSLDY